MLSFILDFLRKFLLILIVPFFVFAHSPTSSNEIIIHMSDKGFEPEEVIINPGTKVIFENISSQPRWPASNLHPTHRLYPNSGIEKCGTPEETKIFDACRPIPPGKTFEFIFNYIGEWRYHDHLFPQMKGKIIVKEQDIKNYNRPTTERQVYLIDKINIPVGEKNLGIVNLIFQKILDFIKNLFSSLFNNLNLKSFKSEQEFLNQDIFAITKNEKSLYYWMKKVGPKKMIEKLTKDSNGGRNLDCHQEAHLIGRAAYKIYGIDLAFQQGDAACHSGFYHGAIEEFIRENGTDNLSQKIAKLCEKFSTQFGKFECLHGLGHGIMAFEDYDLIKALDACDKLGTDYERGSCYGGVFMENIVTGQGLGAVPGHYTEWLSKEDPQFPCNVDFVKNNLSRQLQCWQMQTSWMLNLFNYDFKRVVSECLKAPENMIPVCFVSLGRDIAGFTLRDPLKIIKICDLVQDDNYYSQCIIGAVNVIVDFWGADVNGKATELCKLITKKSAKRTCYETLNARLWDIFPTNDIASRKAVCSTFEKEYQAYCQ